MQGPIDYERIPEAQSDRAVIASFYSGMAVAGIVVLVAFCLACWLLWATEARAHEAPSGMSYPPDCCQGTRADGTGDCDPIPSSSVREIPGGWVITIGPGDHPLATKKHVFVKKYGEERRSTDGAYHICLWPDENTARCFLSPDKGV